MNKAYAGSFGKFGRGARLAALGIAATTLTLTACSAWPPTHEVAARASHTAEAQASSAPISGHEAGWRGLIAAQLEYQESRLRAYRQAAAERAIIDAQLEYQASRTRAYRDAAAAPTAAETPTGAAPRSRLERGP